MTEKVCICMSCSTGRDNSAALSCTCLWGGECVCVCVWGGGGGSVVTTLIGSLHNLMHTILKTPSAVIARAMGWNCSIVSVSHLSQSQLVGDTNTSPADGVCGRG